MDIEKDSNREAFESWFESRYDANFMQFLLYLDMYVDKHTQKSWEAWQAAKAQAVPDGFVLMPKEPIKEVVEAFWNSWLVEKPYAQTIFFAYKAMIEAQEQAND